MKNKTEEPEQIGAKCPEADFGRPLESPHDPERAEIKARENAHFSGEGVYVLSFLERDHTAIGRLLIRLVLSVWDRHLIFVKPEWVKGKRVLDACCGNPRIVQYFQTMGATFSAGCDICKPVMMRGLSTNWNYALEKRFRNNHVPLFVSDSESLPVKVSGFDTVFIFQTLHHLQITRFLGEANRILAPGGILFISDPNGSHPLRKVADAIGRGTRIMTSDEQAFKNNLLESELKRAGFQIIEKHSVNFFSEIFFLFTVIVEKRSPLLAGILRMGLIPLKILDAMLEITLFRAMPSLAWRNIIIAQNNNHHADD